MCYNISVFQTCLYFFQATLKACVYFLRNVYFSPNDRLSKLRKMFFISSKKLFSSSHILSASHNNPPDQGVAGGLKLHLTFLELKNCLTSSYVKFALLMLNINDGVPL